MKMDNEFSTGLFDLEEPWRKEWQGMPEFSQEDLTPIASVLIHFATPGDMQAFAELIGQKLTRKTKSVWYPAADSGDTVERVRYAHDA